METTSTTSGSSSSPLRPTTSTGIPRSARPARNRGNDLGLPTQDGDVRRRAPAGDLGGNGVADHVDLLATPSDRARSRRRPPSALVCCGRSSATSGNCRRSGSAMVLAAARMRPPERLFWPRAKTGAGSGSPKSWSKRQDVAHRRPAPAVDRLERVTDRHDRVAGTEQRHAAGAAAPSTCPGTRRAAPSRSAHARSRPTSATCSARQGRRRHLVAEVDPLAPSLRATERRDQRDELEPGPRSVAGLGRIGGELARRSASTASSSAISRRSWLTHRRRDRRGARSARRRESAHARSSAVSRRPSAGNGPGRWRTTDSASWMR